MSTTQSTAPGNTFLPPGAPDPNVTQVPDYPPAVTIVDEAEHKAQEEAATAARVERAAAVSSPGKLSEQEKLSIGLLLKLIPVPEGQSQENVPLDTPIPLESLPEELRNSFFDTDKKKNLAQRGIVKLHTNTETKQIDSLSITDIAFDIYNKRNLKSGQQRQTTKADGTPRAPGGRTSKAFVGLRLRRMVDSPRKPGTGGYPNWKLYEDGMSYAEYMAKKDTFEKPLNTRGVPVDVPSIMQFTNDLTKGWIALYREDQPEFLEDGSPNPEFWVTKNVIQPYTTYE